jgi:hypothetical protein
MTKRSRFAVGLKSMVHHPVGIDDGHYLGPKEGHDKAATGARR